MTSQLQNNIKTKKAIHPRTGLELIYDDRHHTYTDANGESYTSVTKAVKLAFPPFDRDTIAARVADRDDRPIDQVIAEWEESGRVACRYGTRCHETAEALILSQPIPHQPETEKERVSFSAIWGFINQMRASGWKFLAAEAIVFSPHLRIAGTVDLIATDSNGVTWILDWKTNKEIVKNNRWNKYGLWPLDASETGFAVPDNNFHHYTLQLNTYQLIIQLEEYMPVGTRFSRALLHVHGGKVDVLPVPEMRNETIGAIIVPYINIPF